jgi:hypothetical protein
MLMPLTIARLLWTKKLNGQVNVGWGKIVEERADLVATAGSNLFLFIPSPDVFQLSATIDLGKEILSLDVGLPAPVLEHIVLGLDDRLEVYGKRDGAIAAITQTTPEAGARYVDIAIADIDNDGKEEVIAAAAGNEALFFYRQSGQAPEEMHLELFAIRVMPGVPQKVTVVRRGEGQLPLIAAAYRSGDSSGILTLVFTETGFEEGPFLENLPATVDSMTAGTLNNAPDELLFWGGGDGSVRAVAINQELVTLMTTENLGTSVPALAEGRLLGNERPTLVAGTPEGYLFGFDEPELSTSPAWALATGHFINDLSISEEGLLALGADDGWLQVWLLSNSSGMVHKVQPGENLFSIAALYNTTAAAIIDYNRLNSDLIYPGRYLAIP